MKINLHSIIKYFFIFMYTAVAAIFGLIAFVSFGEIPIGEFIACLFVFCISSLMLLITINE